MLTYAIDRIEARLSPYAKIISILAMVWFWVGIAIQAGFIDFFDLPPPVERAIFWAGVLFNAVWWGWLRPTIEQRRKLRAEAPQDRQLSQPSP